MKKTMMAIRNNPPATPRNPPLMWCFGAAVTATVALEFVVGSAILLKLTVGSWVGRSAIPVGVEVVLG